MNILSKFLEFCINLSRIILKALHQFLVILLSLVFFLFFMLLGALLWDPPELASFFSGVMTFIKTNPLWSGGAFGVVLFLVYLVGWQAFLDLLNHVLDSLYDASSNNNKK